jgi:hypothetical protein
LQLSLIAGYLQTVDFSVEFLTWQKVKTQQGLPTSSFSSVTELILVAFGSKLTKDLHAFNLDLEDRSTRSNVFTFAPVGPSDMLIDGDHFKVNFCQKPPELICHLVRELISVPIKEVFLDLCAGTGAFTLCS